MKRVIYTGSALSEAQIEEYAPSVMNLESPFKHSQKNIANIGKPERRIINVTDKYKFFPTISLIRDMYKIGWLPYIVEQRQVHKEVRKNFTKHMVVFRNPSLEEVDHLIPEISVTNSHDGRNSFRFHVGLFNTEKQTTYVVFNTDIESFKVKHQGYSFDQVKEVVSKVIEIIPVVYGHVRRMKEIQLSPLKKINFALEAIKVRWKEGKDQINLEDVIKPIRESEKEDNLWNLLNTVQEKIVSGGIKYNLHNGARQQTARSLVNIDQKIDVKKTLWKLAATYVVAYDKTHKKQAA